MTTKLRIPTFQANVSVVDQQGRFTPQALRTINDALQQITTALNAIIAIPGIQDSLAQLDTATQAAQDAATAANTAASSASSAASDANDTAKLANSYIDPSSVLTYDGTNIVIAAHTRYYADGTSVAVNSGTVAPGGTGTRYVFYNDPSYAGGGVSYQVSSSNPAQTSGVHVVGAITVPTTGTATGGQGPRKPGAVTP